MKKVCMIVPKGLPLPNVLGGAIETLVTHLINQNEKEKKVDLTVVSVYDKLAYQESKKYKETKFIYIRPKSISYIIKSVEIRIKNYMGSKLNTYNEYVLKKIKKDYDYVFVEGGAYDYFESYLKYFDKKQMVFHLHHSADGNNLVNKTFDKLIGVSNYVIKNFQNEAKINNSYLLKNCINIPDFTKKISKKEINDLKIKLGFNVNDFVVIFCGRLIKEKGVLELVRAINNIEDKNIKLLIVGSINFGHGGRDEYTELLYNEAKSDKVKFTGYVDNKDLYKYYNLANIMVVPSMWEEAAGLVCIEGMICKKPLIITDSGGINEYVSKENIVIKRDKHFIENLEKEIINLYNKKDSLKELGENNYNYVLNYSKENYYNNFVKLIEEDFENAT